MEGARRGFGHIKMYIPFLDFLCKEGFFEEAKNLFEQWVEHRPDDKENYNTQLMGGMIYSNLLEINKAIEWFTKITETSESALACANLGKLYLIKGDKQKAIDCLEKSKDVKGDIFLKKGILSVISRDEWKPLKLSLCMIARDEETTIGKSLRSVEDIVDEIIVIDTGSLDRTREIVKKHGGKVFEIKWEDDFSKAKNLALEQATGDYILFMDADEYIDPGNKFALALFKKLLPTGKDIAFAVKVEPAKESKSLSMSYLDMLLEKEEGEYQIRLFPGKEEIQFQGMVFEDVNESLKSAGVRLTRNDLFKITHSMEGRERRDKKKILAVSNSFESIRDPQKALKAGILFLRLGDLDSAYPWLIRVQEMNLELSAKIGKLYSGQNKLEMAKDILAGALEQFPESSELILSMAEVTGNLGDGIEYLAFAHEKNPANILYKIAGIYAFSKVDQWEEALQVIYFTKSQASMPFQRLTSGKRRFRLPHKLQVKRRLIS
jgi:glycosyltransferase involved in cell wall biosynthesis